MNTELLDRQQGYMPQSKSCEWGTPKAFFDELDREFRFTLDVCASDLNTKCPIYFTKEQDGLSKNWYGVAFCNPPYGAKEISKWMKKARVEAQMNHATTVLLVPNTTDVGWFHEFIYNVDARAFYPGVECRFVKGRINFDPPPGQESISNVKGSLVIVIRPVSRHLSVKMPV